MEIHHESVLTVWVNGILGGPVAWLLESLGFHVDAGHPPIPDHIVMASLVALLLIVGALIFRRHIRVENPSKVQLALEMLVGALLDMLLDNIGPKGRKYLALVGTLGLFILLSNLMGLFPFLTSPTTNLNLPVGCALVSFVYYNYQGIREQGAGTYIKHFLGPVPLLAPIMLPIELVSHLSRIVSLSIRLFGNIFGEELVIIVLGGLVPLFIPLPMMAFAIFGSLLQAFIFIMLTMIYLGGAVASAEH